MAEMTKCWDCANATNNGCSWSRDLVPVDGWEAVPTVKKQFKGEKMHSFIVIQCPEFVRDAWNGGALRPKEYEEKLNKENRMRMQALKKG